MKSKFTLENFLFRVFLGKLDPSGRGGEKNPDSTRLINQQSRLTPQLFVFLFCHFYDAPRL